MKWEHIYALPRMEYRQAYQNGLFWTLNVTINDAYSLGFLILLYQFFISFFVDFFFSSFHNSQFLSVFVLPFPSSFVLFFLLFHFISFFVMLCVLCRREKDNPICNQGTHTHTIDKKKTQNSEIVYIFNESVFRFVLSMVLYYIRISYIFVCMSFSLVIQNRKTEDDNMI